MAFTNQEILESHRYETSRIKRLRERIHANNEDTVKRSSKPFIKLSECVVKRVKK